MPQVNPISFTAPNTTGTPPAIAPRSRSELMAYLLERGAPATPDYSSVQSPIEGVAKALTSGLQGVMAKKALQGEEEKKQQQAGALADLLLGPTADGAPDPRRDQLAAVLSGGVPAGFGEAITAKLGLGETPETWEPTEQFGLKGQRSTKSGKFDPFPSSADVKPYTDAAQIAADVRNGFLTAEEGQAATAQLSQGLFEGTSVEAQSLNGLVAAGKLTEDQAMQLGAGKTITGPNGEIIFMTPEGVFAQPGVQGQTEAAPVATAPLANDAARPGMIPLTGKKTEGTEGQMAAALYVDRMKAANQAITLLEAAGTDLTDTLVSQVPILGNYGISEDFQKLDQAKRDFVNAVLRRESGAVISPSEFDNANKQYFPQPGDTPETIEQKRRNRGTAIAGIERAAGPNYKGAPQALEEPLPTPRLKFNPATGELE